MMVNMMQWAKEHVIVVIIVAVLFGQLVGVGTVAFVAGDLVTVGRCVASSELLDSSQCVAAFTRVTGR